MGLAASRRADRDLVRTDAGLSEATGPGVCLLPTSHVPGLDLPSTWSCRQAAAGAMRAGPSPGRQAQTCQSKYPPYGR